MVRRCNTSEDHDAGNCYGSRRGIAELMGKDGEAGRLAQVDPLAHALLCGDDENVGRAAPLQLEGTRRSSPVVLALRGRRGV